MFSQWGRLVSFLIFVEERGPVHIGITDTIVAIGVHRAGIVTIVTVAQQFDATEAAPGESTSSAEMRKWVQRYSINVRKQNDSCGI